MSFCTMAMPRELLDIAVSVVARLFFPVIHVDGCAHKYLSIKMIVAPANAKLDSIMRIEPTSYCCDWTHNALGQNV